MSTMRAANLSIGYKHRRQSYTVASGINMEVVPGQIICLLGPNGAGKTTLLRSLLGLQPPLSGQIELDDKNIAAMSRRAIASQIAFVPQDMDPVFDYTVLEIVLMGRTTHLGALGQPRAHDYHLATEALAQLGIGSLAAQRLSTLSGGQRQLVLIARALAQDGQIIALDEPAASLDFGFQAHLLKQLKQLTCQQNRAVLMSTHFPQHALTLRARVLVINGGAIIADGPAHNVLTSELLSALYNTVVRVEQNADGELICYAGLPGDAGSAGASSDAESAFRSSSR